MGMAKLLVEMQFYRIEIAGCQIIHFLSNFLISFQDIAGNIG